MNNDELAFLALSIVSFPALFALYRLFQDPEKIGETRSSKVVAGAIILSYIGFSIFSLLRGERFFSALFVAFPLLSITLFRNKLRQMRAFSSRFGIFLFPLFLLWFDELFSVLDYRGPIFSHYLAYFGFYVGIASVIYFFYRRWQFTFAQVFTIGGLWGILVEQGFMLPKLLLQGINGDLNAIFILTLSAPFIFIVYGLYLAIPYLLFYEDIKGNKKSTARQTLSLLTAIVLIPLLSWGIWTALLAGLSVDLSGVI